MKKGTSNISIIIPSYNGINLLKKYLPIVLEECENYPGKTEIIVVDDGSTDGTADLLLSLFPQVRVIRKSENEGFVKSINLGIKQAKYPFVFLLNNDIEITLGILQQLMNCFFEDKRIFAVQPKIISSELEENSDYINVFFQKYGIWRYKYQKMELKCNEFVEMDFASGGCSMFKKDKLIALNLFDDFFSPGYFEDIDICFRAKLFGWKILYQPLAKVYHHKPGSTIKKKFTYFNRNLIHKRNYFFFIFKNLLYLKILPVCLITIPGYLLYKLFTGDIFFLLGFVCGIAKFLKRKQRPMVSNNILFIDTPLFPPGGGQMSLLNLVENLQLFQPFVIFDRKTEIVNRLSEEGIPVCINNISKVNVFFSIIRSIYLVNLISPIVIHSNSPTTFCTFIFAFISKMLNIPFVWHVRVVESAGWRDKIISLLCRKIIVISDAVKRKFSYVKSNKVVKIYNAVDTEKFKPGLEVDYLKEEFNIPKDRKIIGIISRLDPWKGHKLFLEMAKIVKEKLGDNVIFLVAGTGEEKYKKELVKLTKELKLVENVIFTGFREDIPQIINLCDVIVNPSIEPEPFGRTIIEAMSCEKTVIATNIGGPKEIIENGINGFLVDIEAEELADTLLKILDDEKLRVRIGRNARRKVLEKFDIKSQIEETERLYKELIYGE